MYTQNHAGRYISKLSNKVRRRIDAFSKSNDFSGSQGKVLHFLLAQQGDIFQKDIEEEYCLRPSSATELLKKMEQNNLIRRESIKEDGRKKKIILTPKALQYKDTVERDIMALEDDLKKGISEEDLEVFFKVTQKMLDNMSDE